MNNFANGFICAIGLVLFGKVMYEKGKRKNGKKVKRIGKYTVTIEEDES